MVGPTQIGPEELGGKVQHRALTQEEAQKRCGAAVDAALQKSGLGLDSASRNRLVAGLVEVCSNPNGASVTKFSLNGSDSADYAQLRKQMNDFLTAFRAAFSNDPNSATYLPIGKTSAEHDDPKLEVTLVFRSVFEEGKVEPGKTSAVPRRTDEAQA